MISGREEEEEQRVWRISGRSYKTKGELLTEEFVTFPLCTIVVLKHGEKGRGKSTTKPFPVTILIFD